MVNPDLPKDIMVQIFLRLPLKSVGRCRCLSRTWATDLKNQRFVSSYHAFKSRQENVLFLNHTGSLETIALPMKDDNISRNVLPRTKWEVIVGSCNGLVLLLNIKLDMFLVNPITLQHAAIPNSYLPINFVSVFRCGFGYDSSTDDYKVLTLSYHRTENEHVPRLESMVDVYSVKARSWKRIKCSPAHTIYGAHNGYFINGAVHWYSNSNVPGDPSKILAFDLGSEVFREIPNPIRVCDETFFLRRLCVLEGCLCIIDCPSATGDYTTGNNTLYVMKEYGKASSWTKFSMNSKGLWDMYEPVCFIGNKELMFVTFGKDVLVYNFEDATTRRVVVNGQPSAYRSGVVFMESLVSPNGHAAFA